MPNLAETLSPCPSTVEWSQLAAGQLGEGIATELQTHLQACATCREIFNAARAQQDPFATLDTPQPRSLASTISLFATTEPDQAAIDPSAKPLPHSRYKIGAQIARGGMGVVHRATDLLFKREVAIKLLRPNLRQQAQAIEAFRYEAEITARLQHPGIPPVHELGQLPSGDPFLAMKLIQGKTLEELLQARTSPQQDLPRWLQVFEQIAQAVGYAHSQGIIHRDLKPLNIMVGEFGEVQVMDWGLAKVIGAPEQAGFAAEDDTSPDNRQFISRVGDVKGTLQYMPPEQARGEIDKLDARADVFALGAILCQILTGGPPISGENRNELYQRAMNADVSAAARSIQASGADGEIIEIATRCLAAQTDARPTNGTAVAAVIAAHRTSVEERLRAAETERALAQQRLVEQSRRRKLWYGIAAALVLLAVASSSFAVYYARSVTIIADREKKARDATRLALDRETIAKNESATTAAVNDFLQNDLLRYADASVQTEEGIEIDPGLTVRDLLLRAANRIDGKFVNNPLVAAKTRFTIGNALLSVGEFQEAIKQLNLAFLTVERILGPEHEHTLLTGNNLAIAYREGGDYQAAIQLHLRVLAVEERVLGTEHVDTIGTIGMLAAAYSEAGRETDALRELKRCYELSAAHFGHDSLTTAAAMNNLARQYYQTEQRDSATPLFENALKIAEKHLGPNHPTSRIYKNNLYRLRQPADSLAQIEADVNDSERMYGPEHPTTLRTLQLLAEANEEAGNLQNAAVLFRKCIDRQTARFGAEHPETIRNLARLGTLYDHAGQFTEGIVTLEKALQASRKKHGVDHPMSIGCMVNLAGALNAAGRPNDAVQLGEEARTLSTKVHGAAHRTTIRATSNLASSYRKIGRLAEAIELSKAVIEAYRHQAPVNDAEMLLAMNNLSVVYMDANRPREALQLQLEALSLMQGQLGEQHHTTLMCMHNLAKSYYALDRYTEALNLHRQTQKQMRAVLGPEHLDTLRSLLGLAQSELQAGRIKEAREHLESGANIARKLPNELRLDFLASFSLFLVETTDADGDLQAVKHWRAEYESIIAELTISVPATDARLQRQIAEMHFNCADMYTRTREFERAKDECSKGFALTQDRKLSSAKLWQTAFTAQIQLSDALMKAGRPSDAQREAKTALSHAQAAFAESSQPARERDISIAFERIGDSARRMQLLDEAYENYAKMHAIKEKLLRLSANELQAKRDLSVAKRSLGIVLFQMAKYSDAKGHLDAALKLSQEVMQADPNFAVGRFDVASCNLSLADVFRLQGDYESAITHYRAALRVAEELIASKQLLPEAGQVRTGALRQIKFCEIAPLAMGDLEKLLETDRALLPQLLVVRSTESLKANNVKDAEVAAAKLRELFPKDGLQLYNAGCLHVMCSAKLPESATREEDTRRLHATAISCLREAIAAGFKEFDHMRGDADLRPLHDNPDFKTLFPSKDKD